MDVKDEIIIEIDDETKEVFREMASRRGVTVSTFLLGIISEGAKLERVRRENDQRVIAN